MSETNEKSLRLRIKSLEHLLEIANEKVSQLEAILGMDQPFPAFLALTPQQSRLLGCLLKKPIMHKAAAMAALYSDQVGDAAEQKIVDVYICKMRPKLKLYDIIIETVHGIGYSLPQSSKDKLKALCKDHVTVPG